MLTIMELAAKHGQVMKLGKGLRVGRDPLLTAAHRAACVLNGWNKYELKTGELAKLTDEAYLAAIAAAKTGDAHAAAKTGDAHDAAKVSAPSEEQHEEAGEVPAEDEVA